MSRKPENTFLQSVHRHLAPSKPHFEKMHNEYRGGTADVWYSGTKADIWIEYKFLPRKPQRGDVHLCNPNVKAPILSRLQQNWLRDRHVEGRSVYVIVGCSDGGVIMSGLEWENPIPATVFNERIASRKELADWIRHKTMR